LEEEDQPVSCSEDELLNPDTGECEVFYLNEICNNQEGDDLDVDVDVADVDCLPVFTNATDSTIQERMMSLSPPSSLPISPSPEDLVSSENEEEGGEEAEDQRQDAIQGEEDSIAEDFLQEVPS
jgi:hypothetical protein